MNYCNDYGDPMAMAEGCLKEADPEYTMDYTDVKNGGFIYWCTTCGKRAKMWEEMILLAIDTRPGFQDDFKQAIEDVQSNTLKH